MNMHLHNIITSIIIIYGCIGAKRPPQGGLRESQQKTFKGGAAAGGDATLSI
mgnify:FL=1